LSRIISAVKLGQYNICGKTWTVQYLRQNLGSTVSAAKFEGPKLTAKFHLRKGWCEKLKSRPEISRRIKSYWYRRGRVQVVFVCGGEEGVDCACIASKRGFVCRLLAKKSYSLWGIQALSIYYVLGCVVFADMLLELAIAVHICATSFANVCRYVIGICHSGSWAYHPDSKLLPQSLHPRSLPYWLSHTLIWASLS
jgi:hypothetical protein